MYFNRLASKSTRFNSTVLATRSLSKLLLRLRQLLRRLISTAAQARVDLGIKQPEIKHLVSGHIVIRVAGVLKIGCIATMLVNILALLLHLIIIASPLLLIKAIDTINIRSNFVITDLTPAGVIGSDRALKGTALVPDDALEISPADMAGRLVLAD